MKSLAALLVLPVIAIALFADPAAARPSRRDAVQRAYSHVDARGLEGCRVDTVADLTGSVRVSLTCPPHNVVVVIGDDRRTDQVIVRPRPRPTPPPRETVVIIDDDDDSDSDSDRKHKKHKHKHGHDCDDDSDSDSDSG